MFHHRPAASQPQDENAVGMTNFLHTSMGNNGGKASAFPQPPPTQRKALGNISSNNQLNNAGGDFKPTSVSKQATGTSEPRRAFADLTNSSMKPGLSRLNLTGKGGTPAPGMNKPPSMFQAHHVPVKAIPIASRAVSHITLSAADELRAARLSQEAGPESLAGKSWQQMEAERVRKQEEDLRQKPQAVHLIAAPHPILFAQVGNYWFHRGRDSAASFLCSWTCIVHGIQP